MLPSFNLAELHLLKGMCIQAAITAPTPAYRDQCQDLLTKVDEQISTIASPDDETTFVSLGEHVSRIVAKLHPRAPEALIEELSVAVPATN